MHWLNAVYKQNLYISSHESYWIQVMHNHVMFNYKDKDIIIILRESNSLNNLSCNNNNEIQCMKWEYQYENYFKCSNVKSNQWQIAFWKAQFSISTLHVNHVDFQIIFQGKNRDKKVYLFKWGETMLCLSELRPLQGVQRARIASYDELKSMPNSIQLIIN